jgi:hypothetical protein
MKAKLLLRVAAIIMLLHTAGHTVGAITWKDAPNAAVKQTIDGMISNQFDFMGRQTSLASFFAGYGYIMIGVLLLISVILWLLSTQTNSSITLVMGLFLLFMGVAEYIYFFPFAAVFSLLAGVATLWAATKLQQP